MHKQYDFSVIGGDLRQIYMVNEFIRRGYSVITYGLPDNILIDLSDKASTLIEALKSSSNILCPVPFTKDKVFINGLNGLLDGAIENLYYGLDTSKKFFGGNIPEDISKYCTSYHIPYFDLMEMNDIAILNALATAEGAICEAINKSVINLHNSNCLVLGFGRCASVLAKKLRSLDAEVCIAARNKDARALAVAFGYTCVSLDDLDDCLYEYDFIFNTIPSIILTKDRLEKVSPGVVIIDIASAPGGINYDAAKALNLNASLCLALPGKYAPKTSGEILANAIEHIIFESSDKK